MSRLLLSLPGLLGAATLACAGLGGSPATRIDIPALEGPAALPSHVLLISVAGLGPERYRRDPAAQALSMPALTTLAEAGVAADVVEGVTPASLYPAHATLVTGELPAQHGIAADRLLGPQGVRTAHFTHASRLHAATLWQRSTEAGRRVAALAWPTTVGGEIAMLLPDLEPMRGGETWLGVQADAATPALLALARANGGDAPAANQRGPARDGVLVGIACSLLSSPQPPALLLLRLSQTEPVLLRNGPGSPEVEAAFAQTDREIARLFGCLRRGPARDSAAVLVTGDHGFAPVYSVLAPNVALAQAGLL
ncbi:MAG TPA: alkaline phosphatase family protein, partial [Candidatus Limnocylindrales bacterium]